MASLNDLENQSLTSTQTADEQEQRSTSSTLDESAAKLSAAQNNSAQASHQERENDDPQEADSQEEFIPWAGHQSGGLLKGAACKLTWDFTGGNEGLPFGLGQAQAQLNFNSFRARQALAHIQADLKGTSAYDANALSQQNADRIRDELLDSFDPYVEHTQEEYDNIIAKARSRARQKHAEFESRGRSEGSSRDASILKTDILARAKELANAALTNKSMEDEVADAFADVKSSSAAVDADNVKQLARGPKANIKVGENRSAYDDNFGGDFHKDLKGKLKNAQEKPQVHEHALNPGFIQENLALAARDYISLRAIVGKKAPDEDVDGNETDIRFLDFKFFKKDQAKAADAVLLPAEAFSNDGPPAEDLDFDESIEVISEMMRTKKGDQHFRAVQEANAATEFDSDHELLPFVDSDSFDIFGGLSCAHPKPHHPYERRGDFRPTFFLYDHAQDRYLFDEGSSRLLGLTYTGDWLPARIVTSQVSFVDEDLLSTCFESPEEGDFIVSHIRINQGPHAGERMYMSGSVVQRDETGLALMCAGVISELQAEFVESLYKIYACSSTYEINVDTDEVIFAPGYKHMVGKYDDAPMPATLKGFEASMVHAEDVNIYNRQNEVIDNPKHGDYYENIYRIKHAGGFYLWVMDRGLVVERQRSGKASRIVGTTTNIDVVRSNFERLKRSIYEDPLTGLHNRLYLNTRSKYFIMEESQPLTLCYVDISGLKVINDNLGHALGDELVKTAAIVLQNDIFLDHELVRLSGDEFLLIFTNCTSDDCKAHMDQFVIELEQRNLNQEFNVPVFVGYGVATLNEIDDGDTFTRCEARADKRLQEYKTEHRAHIYGYLREYIEASLGHAIELTDNRRLEYLDQQQNEPDVVPSDYLKQMQESGEALAEQVTEAAQSEQASVDASSIAADAAQGSDSSIPSGHLHVGGKGSAQGSETKSSPEDTIAHPSIGHCAGPDTYDEEDSKKFSIGIADAHEKAVRSTPSAKFDFHDALRPSAQAVSGKPIWGRLSKAAMGASSRFQTNIPGSLGADSGNNSWGSAQTARAALEKAAQASELIQGDNESLAPGQSLSPAHASATAFAKVMTVPVHQTPGSLNKANAKQELPEEQQQVSLKQEQLKKDELEQEQQELKIANAQADLQANVAADVQVESNKDLSADASASASASSSDADESMAAKSAAQDNAAESHSAEIADEANAATVAKADETDASDKAAAVEDAHKANPLEGLDVAVPVRQSGANDLEDSAPVASYAAAMSDKAHAKDDSELEEYFEPNSALVISKRHSWGNNATYDLNQMYLAQRRAYMGAIAEVGLGKIGALNSDKVVGTLVVTDHPLNHPDPVVVRNVENVDDEHQDVE